MPPRVQLTRDERVQLFGIDCDDEVVWHDWQPGKEGTLDLVLQNVALVTQKLKFKLPSSEQFDMPYPEAFKLAPGMAKSIPISFRPQKYVSYVDYVQIITKGGSFTVTVKAVVKDVAVTIPHFVDFGLCPIVETSEVPIEVFNTGTLPAQVRWKVKPPFKVEPETFTIDVGRTVDCMVLFEPKVASVFEAMLSCEAVAEKEKTNDDEEATLEDEQPFDGATEGDVKKYPMQVTGVGKVPHLCVPSSTSPSVNFGPVLPGVLATQTLQILNVTPVRGTWHIHAVNDSHEILPLPPPPFTVTPEKGVVEANCAFTLNFNFLSDTVRESTCQRFQISTPGGTPLVVTCNAFCEGKTMVLSTDTLNFGEIPCGTIASRTLQIRNESNRPAYYHFANVGHLKGVFWFDRHIGVVPPQSFMVVTVFFGPLTPMNYYKRLYCVVKGAATPLVLDLIGSCHTDTMRPARLEQNHVNIFRQMQANGVREHPPPAKKASEKGDEEDEQHHDEEDDFIPETPAPTLSSTATYLEMMLPPDSNLRDVTIYPHDLDFGSASLSGQSEKKTIQVTNNTSHKVNVVWMIAGETRMPCYESEKGLFGVYPQQMDIKPRGSAEFVVSFRPQQRNSFDAEFLEAVVYHKVNRNFRLVDLKRFTPPWSISAIAQGHTMGLQRYEPRIELSETDVRFRACTVGERTYQTVMLTNKGDTNVAYHLQSPIPSKSAAETSEDLKAMKEQVPFRAWPTRGIIPPHQFNLVVLEFVPTVAQNEQAFIASFPLVIDYNESNPRPIRVAGRCWEPKLSICRDQLSITFPPTCSGITSGLVTEIKNVSEIPVSFECKIPSRFRNTFWFPISTGQLLPSESTNVTAQFMPDCEKIFCAPMYTTAKALVDNESIVDGPLKALMAPPSSKKDPVYAMQLVGHGKAPAISLDPAEIDFGPVQAFDEVKGQVRILNSSNLMVHYMVTYEFVEADIAEPLDEEQDWQHFVVGAKKSLKLSRTDGSVAGRCTEVIEISFTPPRRGPYQYRVHVTPLSDKEGGADGHGVVLNMRADVQYPFIQIADLRTESVGPQPQSMMWQQFQVDGINELYRGEVADVERGFQAAIGIDRKKQLVKQLKPFQLLFGTAAAGSPPTVVYLAFANPGPLKATFSFQTPKNLNLEHVPTWCDERAVVEEHEAHFAWVEDHSIYDIQPRSGEIPPGDFLHVRLAYHHYSVGTHILPVVFNVHDGRSILLYLKAHSVAPNVGCLSVRSPIATLQPVPLGVESGPMQSVELTNNGAVSAPWRINMDSILELNAKSYDFEVLRVSPTEGVLDPQSSTFLHFKFTPLEAKDYQCVIRIEMLKDGQPVEELTFELQANSYDPRGDRTLLPVYFPENLPVQTYAPVPGCGAALSVEYLNFDKCPLRSDVSRMLVLVNYTSEFILTYRWGSRQLFRSDEEFRIEPNCGELSPGSHQIIVFRLWCDDPADVAGEVECAMEWTHVSAYGQKPIGDMTEVDESRKAEYLAFHAGHVHEPSYSKKHLPLEARHISVANRLTVSRFRNLMSTPAGQKFLNENLHRTALVSSHLPSVTPRRGLASTLGGTNDKNPLSFSSTNMSTDGGVGTKVNAPPAPPTSFPLYVRIRATVADWEVQKLERNNFLVSGPPAPDDLEEEDSVTKKEAPSVSHPDPLDFEMASGVIEHMLREVVGSESFSDIIDNMLTQETPYFVQFENSAPPGEQEFKSKESSKDASGDVEDTAAYQERMAQLAKDLDRPEPKWSSALLMNFEDCRPPRMIPEDDQLGDDSSDEEESEEPSVDRTPKEETKDGEAPDPEVLWDATCGEYGEVDLDTFKSSVAEVLEDMLLSTMDDVICGRFNWTRPPPRTKPRR
jgi:hypothetical protein